MEKQTRDEVIKSLQDIDNNIIEILKVGDIDVIKSRLHDERANIQNVITSLLKVEF